MSNNKALAVVYQISSSAHNLSDAEAVSALRNWADVMQKGNPDAVVPLYDKEASFWGTLADDLATDPTAFKAYFVGFLGNKSDIKIDINSHYAQSLGPSCIVSGLYTFNFKDEHGLQQAVNAAYSFTFKKNDDGEIVIINHHSSKRPAVEPSNDPK